MTYLSLEQKKPANDADLKLSAAPARCRLDDQSHDCQKRFKQRL
jgi:hypothetical protein